MCFRSPLLYLVKFLLYSVVSWHGRGCARRVLRRLPAAAAGGSCCCVSLWRRVTSRGPHRETERERLKAVQTSGAFFFIATSSCGRVCPFQVSLPVPAGVQDRLSPQETTSAAPVLLRDAVRRAFATKRGFSSGAVRTYCTLMAGVMV